jgi:transcriptional regulator with XRE-family HTH domain
MAKRRANAAPGPWILFPACGRIQKHLASRSVAMSLKEFRLSKGAKQVWMASVLGMSLSAYSQAETRLRFSPWFVRRLKEAFPEADPAELLGATLDGLCHLKRIRLIEGMTRPEMAKRLGVTLWAVARAETKGRYTLRLVGALARLGWMPEGWESAEGKRRAFRLALGLTLREMSARLGVSAVSLKSFENGKRMGTAFTKRFNEAFPGSGLFEPCADSGQRPEGASSDELEKKSE